MKKLLFAVLIILFQFPLHAQTNIYVSNNGTNNGQNQPTLTNPVKTLEQAYFYIKNNLVDSSNEATSPINVFLKHDGGDILVSDTIDTLAWEVSGTSSNPIVIMSYLNRATITRNSDSKHLLQLIEVDYLTIKEVDFNRVGRGAILLDNSDSNEVSHCSFRGDVPIAPMASGIIWMGVSAENGGYTGINSKSSSNNKILHNSFYDIETKSPTSTNKPQPHNHQGVYLSNGAHNNTVSFNSLHFMPGQGILGNHGDYKSNYISSNLISRKEVVDNDTITGVYFTYQSDSIPNGSPNSITGNNAVNNYVYDSYNNFGVKVHGTLLNYNNSESNNKHYDDLYPNDPYWLGYDAAKISDLMVSGDFDNDGDEDDVAAFYDYSGQAKIHVWQSMGEENAFEYSSSNGWWSGTYNTSKIINRVVSGDFDRDGFKDDIAAFYDGGMNSNGNQVTIIHVWESTGSNFPTRKNYWIEEGYDASKISGRIVSGDFDRDNVHDDIAAFYDYGTNSNGAKETRIHVWNSKGNINEFQYSEGTGWWTGNGYNADKITNRVVSGDFARDGFKDAIAAFYDYGTNSNGAKETRIHVWKSTTSSFQYTNSSGWWTGNGYNANKITNRVISGDFDRDDVHDDIAAFYDYGTNSNGANETRIHVWKSATNSFQYINSSGWWNGYGYEASKINGRVISGDFDQDGKLDDISAFYDYSSALGNIRSNVWQSTGSNNLAYINESLGYPWLTDFTYYPINYPTNFKARLTLDTMGQSNNATIAYPNPTSEWLQFEFEDDPFSIKVFDFAWRLILDEKIFDKTHHIDASHLNSGMYFYKIVYKDKTVDGKFLVE